jgi:uncharacterized protein (DUF697 family)
MMPATRDALNQIRKDCRCMVTKRALLSATASVVPVPFTDVATDIVLLKQVIPAISEKFGLSKEQIDEYDPRIAILIYDGAKRLGTHMVGRYVTKELLLKVLKKVGIRMTAKQVARYVPIAGQVLAAGISFSAMTLIINNHINQCYHLAESVITARSGPPA